jgi:hypothetical protein
MVEVKDDKEIAERNAKIIQKLAVAGGDYTFLGCETIFPRPQEQEEQ